MVLLIRTVWLGEMKARPEEMVQVEEEEDEPVVVLLPELITVLPELMIVLPP